jgi:hypothetical protein
MKVNKVSLGTVYLEKDPLTGENIIKFGFGTVPQKVSGSSNLVQKIIIRLYTDFNSNAYSSNIGSSLYGILGAGYKPGDEELLKESFLAAISAVEEQIKQEQSQDSTLTPSQTLSSIKIESIEYSTLGYSWQIKIKVSTAIGDDISFTI